MEASALHAPAGLGRSRVVAGATFLRLRSDEQLVELFRAGHEEAFRAIHDRYRVRLLAYVRQMLPHSRQDAEDALQDVFIRAYAALRANDRHLALRAWLYRIAHNRCIDQLRRNTPILTDEIEATSQDVASDPYAAVLQREDLRKLVLDVQRLPEQQRSALLLRELSGMSYQELADSLELSIPAIKSLLVRARVGLAAAAEARDTSCALIREEIVESHERGARPTALTRRHLADCAGCREYRDSVRGVSKTYAALLPAAPALFLLKWLGVGSLSGAGGSAGGGAAAGGVAVTGSAAAGGAATTGAVASGAVATGGTVAGAVAAGSVGAGHIAALVAAAAAATGGAVAVSQGSSHPTRPSYPAASVIRHAAAADASGAYSPGIEVAPVTPLAPTGPPAPVSRPATQPAAVVSVAAASAAAKADAAKAAATATAMRHRGLHRPGATFPAAVAAGVGYHAGAATVSGTAATTTTPGTTTAPAPVATTPASGTATPTSTGASAAPASATPAGSSTTATGTSTAPSSTSTTPGASSTSSSSGSSTAHTSTTPASAGTGTAPAAAAPRSAAAPAPASRPARSAHPSASASHRRRSGAPRRAPGTAGRGASNAN